MTNYLGDFAPSATVVFAFTTVNSTGVPTVLSGSPQAAIYKGSTSSAITAGVTLALSYVSALTGANLVKIDTSQDTTNYTPGNDYTVALASGLVGTTSVSGYTIGHFSLTNRGPANNVSGLSQTNVVQIAGTVAVSSLALGNTNVVQIAQTGTVSSLALGNTNVVTWVGVGPNALQNGLVQAAILSGGAAGSGNITQINGVAVQAASGILQTNLTQWLGVAPAPLTAALLVQAAQSGVVASNIVQINGVAATSSGAQLGVNVTQWRDVAPAPLTAALVQSSVSGNVAGSVGSVTGAVGSVTARVTANTDQIAGGTVNALISGRVDSSPGQVQANAIGTTGFVAGALTTTVFAAPYLTSALIDTTYSNAVADALLDRSNAIETGLTPRQALRLDAAAQGGKLSGAGTTAVNIWGAGVSTNRISAVTDQSGNRLAVTLNL